MTHRIDVADSRDLLARWCALAEQRLYHLTELFESGRWRRYYSELAFLQNIQEAKAAVETWRSLSACGPLASNFESYFESRNDTRAPEPQPDASLAEAERESPSGPPSAPVIDLTALERAMQDADEPVPDVVAVEQRYPLLRNALYS